MVDWTDTQAFFKEHWRPILIVSLIVIAIVVGISLALVFTLQRTPVPTTSVPAANYPPDLNGDPPHGSDTFAFPQTITNPLPGTQHFGQRLFVHDAGYVAVTVQRTTTYQSVLFYYTNVSGEIEGPQEIALNFLPNGFVVCNGAFAPIFNVAGEVFYLFLSVGTSHPNGNVYPQYVVLFTLDTNVTANVWSVGSINTQYHKVITYPVDSQSTIKVLRLPSDTFTYNQGANANRPWYGTYGAKIQVVLDDNEAVSKQSLYISGSEFDTNRPGGNLYWYILQDNSVAPRVLLLYTIQDAKLLMMQNQSSCPTVASCASGCATFDRYDESNCTNGFASDFYVTSGNGSSNILVVANSTCQDNCVLTGSNQPCAPKGYVQGYTLNTVGGTQEWVQLSSNGSFAFRYIGTASDPNIINPTSPGGFASSVSVAQGKIIIGQAEPNAAGDGVFLVYDWVTAPYQNGALTLLSRLNPSTGAAQPFSQTDLLSATSFIRYNTGVQTIADGSAQILATTWYEPGPADVISIQDPNASGQPFTTFTYLQSLGAGISSNSTTALAGSRSGFAQYTATWLSRTGASVRLATNDPFRANGAGRIVVFTRRRQ